MGFRRRHMAVGTWWIELEIHPKLMRARESDKTRRYERSKNCSQRLYHTTNREVFARSQRLEQRIIRSQLHVVCRNNNGAFCQPIEIIRMWFEYSMRYNFVIIITAHWLLSFSFILERATDANWKIVRRRIKELCESFLLPTGLLGFRQ